MPTRSGQSVFSGIPISSNDQLRFIAQELKPFNDETYSTRRERTYTFIVGRSMGNLISLLAGAARSA
ncbi:MAG: hypothetical protein FJX89_03720 [Bacteroidetes bacterium]|nr:hypothetical protein [Bacteroidota bacterium]